MAVAFDLKRTRELVKAHCLVEQIDDDDFAYRVSLRAGIVPPVGGAALRSWINGTRGLRFDAAVAIADELDVPLNEAFPRVDAGSPAGAA